MEISSKMKAAVLMGPNDLRLKEVDTPQPGPDDVLIQVEAVAVCSSDVALIAKPWPFQPPYGSFIPGHEYAGTIVSVGQSVDRLKVGDRVAVEAHLGCLRCRNCRLGHYTACLNYGQKGHRANGFTTNGGFAQYVVNHQNTVHPIPDTMGFDEAALITNLGCVLYGFQTVGGYIVGDHVAVIGPGPLGLISAAVAKALCAQRVFLVGTRAARLNVGRELGADRVINVHEEDPVKVVREETKGVGADLVVESSGGHDAINMAIRMAKRMGKILMLGLPEEEVKVDLQQLGQENKSIHTVRGEGWANCGRAVSMAGSGRVDLKRLVTHSFAFDQVSEAFKTFVERIGGAIKVTVHPNE